MRVALAPGGESTLCSHLLSRWAGSLGCHSAALAVWLAAWHERWWRPLLGGTPHLAITPQPDGLARFEHHARPPLETLGLAPRFADDWNTARSGYRRELNDGRALVVCGDAYNLPWQRGHQRWHAPYWFTVLLDGRRWVVEDPLAVRPGGGPGMPLRVPVEPGQLMRWSLAPQSYTAIQHLRETSVFGAPPPGLGRRYRWLARGAVPPARRAEPARLVGVEAVEGLAIRYAAAPPGDPIHRQADDVCQAMRQRELVLAAAEVDPGLTSAETRDHWRRSVAGWRRVLPYLMQARSRAGSGPPVDPRHLAGAVAAVAGFETGEGRLAEESAVSASA